jgi:hypothetical protein
MPVLSRQVLTIPSAALDVERALREAIRVPPGVADVRMPKDQYFSIGRPWMGNVGNGRIDAVRQTLNPSSPEWRVTGELHSEGDETALHLALHVGWIELALAGGLAAAALWLFVMQLLRSPGPALDLWISLATLIAVACLIPNEISRRTQRIRSDFLAMSSGNGSGSGIPGS